MGRKRKNTTQDQQCEVPRCKDYPVLGYYGYGVCARHWEVHCSSRPFNLKVCFGITETTEKKPTKRSVVTTGRRIA